MTPPLTDDLSICHIHHATLKQQLCQFSFTTIGSALHVHRGSGPTRGARCIAKLDMASSSVELSGQLDNCTRLIKQPPIFYLTHLIPHQALIFQRPLHLTAIKGETQGASWQPRGHVGLVMASSAAHLPISLLIPPQRLPSDQVSAELGLDQAQRCPAGAFRAQTPQALSVAPRGATRTGEATSGTAGEEVLHVGAQELFRDSDLKNSGPLTLVPNEILLRSSHADS